MDCLKHVGCQGMPTVLIGLMRVMKRSPVQFSENGKFGASVAEWTRERNAKEPNHLRCALRHICVSIKTKGPYAKEKVKA